MDSNKRNCYVLIIKTITKRWEWWRWCGRQWKGIISRILWLVIDSKGNDSDSESEAKLAEFRCIFFHDDPLKVTISSILGSENQSLIGHSFNVQHVGGWKLHCFAYSFLSSHSSLFSVMFENSW